MSFKIDDLLNWIDQSVRTISNLDLQSVENYWPYFTLFSLLLLAYSIYTSDENFSLVDELGLSSNGKKMKIKKKKKFIRFKNVDVRFLEKSVWREKFEIFENIFDQKFIDVKILPGRRPSIQLYYDLLPDFVFFDQSPKLKPMETWVGKNQFDEDVLIDLQSTPAIYLDGKPGSGKTVALMALLKGYLKGVDGEANIVIVSTKVLDFYSLRENESINLKIIDPFEGDFKERIEEILNEFKFIKTAEDSVKKTIERNPSIEPSQMNLEALREIGECKEIPRVFFIFDEAKDYLSKNKADSKPEAELKQQLISAVYTHIRRTARYLSMPIVIASQTQTETDLDIPLKMFHLRLASNTNDAMSRLLCGDKRLTDLSFAKGKFFLKTDKDEHILKVPL